MMSGIDQSENGTIKVRVQCRFSEPLRGVQNTLYHAMQRQDTIGQLVGFADVRHGFRPRLYDSGRTTKDE
jgi:hypothetical protein